jgi:H/ACA ribonucleoprotein complex subunit 4
MRLAGKVLTHDKTYIAVIRFHGDIKKEHLLTEMSKLRGKIYNVPPEISAVKVQVRTRRIDRFELLEFSKKHALVQISCESGTYIRTLVSDLGLLLGMRVELKELRRPSSGKFTLEKSVTMQQLADAYWLWKEREDETAIRRIVHPIEKLVQDMPVMVVKDSAASALSHGAALMRPGIISIDASARKGDRISIHTLKGELVALAHLLVEPSKIQSMINGELARPDIVLMNQDVYPKGWVR